MSSSILEKIHLADNLPSLPTVAVQVLQLIHSENASVGEIAKVIEHDPALTSKILKVANSSLFGMPRQISSLQQAMVVLGLRTVKVMALTFSLVDAMQSKEDGGFDYRSYWRVSLTGAVAGRLLAAHVPACQADELFVTALLSDIGMLAAFQVDKATYLEAVAQSSTQGVPINLVEQARFGATHEAFSAHLLDTWGLPEKMISAIAVHHQPPEAIAKRAAETGNSMISLLGAAVMIADMFCSPGGAKQLPAVMSHVPKLVPISPQQLQELLDTLHKQVQDTACTWSIDIGTARSYKEVQAEAVVQLAKLTMAAELERAQLAVREQELSSQNQNLARKATMDGLTGIANRITLEEHLAHSFEVMARQGGTLGMLMLDLDRFKRLNDTFGHQTGDTALRLVGDYLRSLNCDNRLSARYGGEEFAVVLTNVTGKDIRQLAEEVRLKIQQLRIPFKDRMIPITVSIGGALVKSGNPATLIANADKCLYAAKQNGRNRAVVVDATSPAARAARPSGQPPRVAAGAR